MSYKSLTVEEVKMLILLGRIDNIQVRRCTGKFNNTFEWWGLNLLNINNVNLSLTGYVFRLRPDQ
jgi:hypothetical protein